MQAAADPITDLKLEGITKRFPGILACDNVSMEVRKGEVLALVGENGAGKSTLMNILAGLYQPDAGSISLNGQPVHFHTPNDAFARGIGMVHQNFMLVPNLTVTENVALGLKKLHRFMNLDLRSAKRRILEVSAHHELPVNPDAYIWQLSVGEQQRVELIKTLCFGAQLLILDEPTSALTPQETDDLIDRLKRMTAELSIIFISHKLNEVKELSDRVAILRHGAIVFNGHTANHSTAELAALMTGHEVVLPHNEGAGGGNGETVLSAQGLRVLGDRGNYALDGLDLELRAGEILGLAGVSGNGQRELSEALTGLRPVAAGKVTFHGEDMTHRSPAAMIAAGLGYIPEDRHHEGIVPSFSVKENLVLKDFATPRFSAWCFLRLGEIGRNAEALKEHYDIRCSSTTAAAGSLSGGNIQKVILAREVARAPRALIATYPTRGVDMGAGQFIHSQLLARRGEGSGILLISEELEEIMNLSDRIAVIYKGRILKVVPAKGATRQALGLLMAGWSMNKLKLAYNTGLIVLATFAATVVCAMVLFAIGASPLATYTTIFTGPFQDLFGVSEILVRAVPLILVALGIAISFRSGIINIGAEGQIMMGILASTATALAFPHLPKALLLPMMLLAGAVGGGIWAGIAGLLKAKLGVNEILSTVMLNYIAAQFYTFLLRGPMIDPAELETGSGTPQSLRLPVEAWLSRLVPGTRLHTGLVLALVLAVAVYFLLWRTTWGYRMRAAGAEQKAARYAGIHVERSLVTAMVLAGAFAGLAGAVEVAGVHHRAIENISSGYGFAGIVVALFGALHPAGIVPAAAFFGLLLVGADMTQRSAGVPANMILVLQGVIILAIVSARMYMNNAYAMDRVAGLWARFRGRPVSAGKGGQA